MKKKTQGRRKIEMKKIEKKSALQVTFTKRRHGLFKKASELALLCGVQIAIIVQSPAGKIFAFEHPSVEDLINGVSAPLAETMLNADMSGGRWWEESVDGLGLQELDNYWAALEGLRGEILGEIQKKVTINSSSAPAPAPAPAPSPALSSQDFDFASASVDQDFDLASSTVDQDVDLASSSVDQDFDFASSTVDQDYDFASSNVDQDFDFCVSTPPYVDQVDQDFSGFYDSTIYQDLSSIFN